MSSSNRYNAQLITPSRLEAEEDINTLKGLIYKHLECTESEIAREILADWPTYSEKFWKVSPTVPAAKPVAPETDKSQGRSRPGYQRECHRFALTLPCL